MHLQISKEEEINDIYEIIDFVRIVKHQYISVISYFIGASLQKFKLSLIFICEDYRKLQYSNICLKRTCPKAETCLKHTTNFA